MSEPTPPPGATISDTSQSRQPNQSRQPKSVRDHAREQAGSGRPRGPLALLVVAVAIAAVGVTLTVAGARLRAPAANRALADEAATRQVISAVSGEVQAIFSYSYADIGATQRAAASALAKSAARQYRLLFSQVQTHGQAEKLTLTSRVVRAGVIRLNSGSAELLLFLDQKWVRGAGQPVAAAAQLDIMAQLFGGRWRITAISAR